MHNGTQCAPPEQKPSGVAFVLLMLLPCAPTLLIWLTQHWVNGTHSTLTVASQKNRASQDADHVSVLPFLAFTMDGFLKSHSSPLPLDDSMRDVPQRKAATDLAPSVEFTRLEPMVSNPPAWLDRALRASDGRQEESRVVAEAKERAGAADVSSMD